MAARNITEACIANDRRNGLHGQPRETGKAMSLQIFVRGAMMALEGMSTCVSEQRPANRIIAQIKDRGKSDFGSDA